MTVQDRRRACTIPSSCNGPRASTRGRLGSQLRRAEPYWGKDGGFYTVTIANDGCTPRQGKHGDPTVRVFVEVDDWLKINARTLDRAKAFMTGRLEVEGDMKLAYRLGDTFRR